MKFPFSLTLFGILLSGQIFSQTTTTLYNTTDKAKMEAWVDSVYSGMTLDEKIGQLFMPIVEPKNSWKTRIAEYINNQNIGGLLFGKGTLREQAEITNYAQSIAKTPLLIALDGEWGLSMRLTDAPRFPRNMIIGAIQDEETLKQYGREIARQCREMGIHINFAPSIDVHSNPQNPVIGTRSFSENPQKVAFQGIAFAQGMEEYGVMSVAKHFPGHGDTSEDSHKTLPTIRHDLPRLNSIELLPFKQFIEAGLSGMMIGHLNVPALHTEGMPASLSPKIGVDLLKNEMGFTGLVFTDGMAMKGVLTHSDISVKALLAGNDVILGVVNQKREFDAVKEAVNNNVISQQLLEGKVKKVLEYKYILKAHEFKPIATAGLAQRVKSSQAEWIQNKIYNQALTLLKNESSLLPIKALDKNKIVSVTMGVSGSTFRKWIDKYAPITHYQAQNKTELEGLNSRIGTPDVLIISVNSGFYDDAAFLNLITKAKQTILVLFDLPKNLDRLRLSTDNAHALLVAYDQTDSAQKSAAQALFGGIAISGKLPVSTANFPENSGLETAKTRLAYSLPEEVGINSEKLSEIEAVALQGIMQKAYPGCYVLVAKNGNIIYNRAFGSFEYSNNSPKVTDETVYDLASITKAAATLPAIMKLYDERKIRLQENFEKFVPETKGTNKAKVTLREALLHESGITPFIPYYMAAIDSSSYSGTLFGKRSTLYQAHYAGAWGRTDFRFIPSFIASSPSETHHLPVAKDMYASKAMHNALLKDVVNSNVRTRGKYAYSCLNFMLLKEVVENVSQTDLNKYLQDNFYRKLGAQTTTFQPLKYMSIDLIPPTEEDSFFRRQQIRGYVHDEGAALFGGISGNAGLFSSAEDLAKVCQMFLNLGEYGEERFLKEETVKLFTQTKSSISRRGLGFDKTDPRGGKVSPTGSLAPISVYSHTLR